MEKPENLRQLIEAIESESKRKSLSDEWLEEHGYSTREDMGIVEYAYGIVMVPEDWVLPYLKDLYARLTGYVEFIQDVIRMLDAQATVDAEPMRHGKWLFSDYDYFT